MPAAVGADAEDVEEGGASPSGGSLRLLVLLLLFGLELMVLRKMKAAAEFDGTCTTYVFVRYVVPVWVLIP